MKVQNQIQVKLVSYKLKNILKFSYLTYFLSMFYDLKTCLSYIVIMPPFNEEGYFVC